MSAHHSSGSCAGLGQVLTPNLGRSQAAWAVPTALLHRGPPGGAVHPPSEPLMGSWCPEGREGEGESLGWAPASGRLSGEQRFADGIFSHELLCRCVGLSRERELGLPGVKASLGACVWWTVCRGFSGQPGKPRQVQSKRHVLQEGEQRVCGDGHSPPTPPGPAQHRQLRLLLGSWTEWGPPGPAEPVQGLQGACGSRQGQ